MKTPKMLHSFAISTESVKTKKAPYLGRDKPDDRYIVWSPDSAKDVREFTNFHKARLAAHGLSEKHPDRQYRVFKCCWGRVIDMDKLKQVPMSVVATSVEIA